MTKNTKLAGKALKNQRKECGYTVNEVSEILEIPEKTIRLWEKGKCIPNDCNLFSLEQLYQYPDLGRKVYGRNIVSSGPNDFYCQYAEFNGNDMIRF